MHSLTFSYTWMQTCTDKICNKYTPSYTHAHAQTCKTQVCTCRQSVHIRSVIGPLLSAYANDTCRLELGGQLKQKDTGFQALTCTRHCQRALCSLSFITLLSFVLCVLSANHRATTSSCFFCCLIAFMRSFPY